MSVIRYIVDKGELLAAATVDALDDRQPGDVEVVTHSDHAEAVAEAERDMLAACIAAVGNATYGFRGTYHYIVDETVETAIATLRALQETWNVSLEGKHND